MKIVIIHFLNTEKKIHAEIINRILKAATENGHQVDLINGNGDVSNFRIISYDYVTILAVGNGPFSKQITPRIAEVLATCGNSSGKKGAALILKNFMFSQKISYALMRTMEKEGLILDYSEIIESLDHASSAGKKLG